LLLLLLLLLERHSAATGEKFGALTAECLASVVAAAAAAAFQGQLLQLWAAPDKGCDCTCPTLNL
jgi:hypothetical protein